MVVGKKKVWTVLDYVEKKNVQTISTALKSKQF